MKYLIKILNLYIVLIIILSIISCREYINVSPQTPGTRFNLVYQYDSISLYKSTPGSYFDQTYYSNNTNFMDSIRVDFTGATNIDSSNSCTLSVELVDEDNGGTIISTFTRMSPDSINSVYQIGFNVMGIRSFTVYLNVFMTVNPGQSGNFYTKMKNIKVWEIY